MSYEKLVCKTCGAPITAATDTYRCPFCGTVYIKEAEPAVPPPPPAPATIIYTAPPIPVPPRPRLSIGILILLLILYIWPGIVYAIVVSSKQRTWDRLYLNNRNYQNPPYAGNPPPDGNQMYRNVK